MNARFYQPGTGRFITQDTYSGNVWEPWTQHLYVYCGNNPTNFIDPTGHIAFAIPIIWALIVGAVGTTAAATVATQQANAQTTIHNGTSSGLDIFRFSKMTMVTLDALTYPYTKAQDNTSNIDKLKENDKHHIADNKRHNWNKLVPDPNNRENWDKISKIISLALANGNEEKYGKVKDIFVKTLEYQNEIIKVTYRIIDGKKYVSSAWVE